MEKIIKWRIEQVLDKIRNRSENRSMTRWGRFDTPSFKLTDEPIRQALLDESTIPFYPNLSWLHYELLLCVKDADARLWYLKEAAREQWDYRTLQRNISSQYYYRLLQTPEHLRKEVSDEMRSLTSDFEKDKLKLRNMPLFKVGSVLDLSFYQELENSFFCLDDIQWIEAFRRIYTL